MVWAVSTLHSPLRPAAANVEGWQGRGTECLHPMPVPGPAQLLLTGTRCTHVRAGLLLLRAGVQISENAGSGTFFFCLLSLIPAPFRPRMGVYLSCLAGTSRSHLWWNGKLRNGAEQGRYQHAGL